MKRLIISFLCFTTISLSQPDTLWTKTFSLGHSIGRSVQQTTDGGYIIIGGAPDIELLKTDTNGDTLWAQTFGGSANDVGESVQQTTDGGYIITGHTESYGNGQADVWLIKTDSLGQEDWNQTLGGSLRDAGYSVQHTNDGGYIIVGQTRRMESDLWWW